MTKDEVLSFLASVKSSFFTEFGVNKIGLFGSLARGEQPHDIDIIVEFESGTQDLFDKKYQIQNLLEERFNIHVDICREKFIKPAVRELIMKDVIFV